MDDDNPLDKLFPLLMPILLNRQTEAPPAVVEIIAKQISFHTKASVAPEDFARLLARAVNAYVVELERLKDLGDEGEDSKPS